MLSLWGALDGGIVGGGGELGASVYKESLDRDADARLRYRRHCTPNLRPCTLPLASRASLHISGSKQGRVLHEAAIWQ
jgi:hypothetical protein